MGGIAMKIVRFVFLALLALPIAGHADALFGNSLAGDAKLPRKFGIGIDYFDMSQPYQIDSLTISPPVLPISGGQGIGVDNEVQYVDIKADVWLFPFLDLFAIYGKIDGNTKVDLSGLGLPLPPNIETLPVDYRGDVTGGGLVLAVGGEKWFASLTGSWVTTNLSGDYDSTVDVRTLQPRVGLRYGDNMEFWVGGYLIDAEEKHSGTIVLDLGPLVPGGPVPIDFAVDLSQKEDFNLSVGTHMMFSDSWEATVEIGGGDRETVLANFTYRFE
jgi:hypothetical protein